MPSTNPSQKRYPAELKDRAVRMVLDLQSQDPNDHGVIARVARQLSIGTESLRQWVKQAQVDGGTRPGISTTEAARLAQLEKENRELRRANDILNLRLNLCSSSAGLLDDEVGGFCGHDAQLVDHRS